VNYPDLDRLIPHRPPMRLVEQILEERDDEMLCLGRIPVELCGGPAASPLLGLELAAQAAAVMGALRRAGPEGSTAEPAIGYLVSVRGLEIAVPALPAGYPLTVRVRGAGSVYPLSRYEVSVYDNAALDLASLEDAAPALRATIGTYST